ncbi:MAG TPA: hypothetical protein VNM36_11030, partial [Gemmatimonadaceae bacterium]|nr:hypothetical protein [Gemmatimonadaceae bacterium]
MRETLKNELLGIVLTLVALFLAATLAFQSVPDVGGCWAAGGISGGLGKCLKWAITGFVGPVAAWLLPLAALVHGLRLLGRMQAETDRSWMIFLVGVALLLPIGVALGAGGDQETAGVAGIWGSFIAFYLKRLVGSWGS